MTKEAEAQGFSVAGLETYAALGDEVHELMALHMRGEEWPHDGYSSEAYELAEKLCLWLEDSDVPYKDIAWNVEQRLTIIDPIRNSVLSHGTCDAFGGTSDWAYGIDWKSGEDPGSDFDDKERSQALDYMLGIAQKMARSKIRFYVVWAKTGRALMIEWQTVKDPSRRLVHLMQRDTRVETGREPLNQGPWCRICPAAGICPVAMGSMRIIKNAADFEIEKFDADRVNDLLVQVVDVLEPCIKSLRKRAKEMAEDDPGCLAGFKAIESSRRSVDVELAYKRLCEENAAIHPEEFKDCVKKSITIANLERLMAKGSRCLGKDMPKKHISALLDEIAGDAIKHSKPTVSLRRAKG
jgi:hypothetical protein